MRPVGEFKNIFHFSAFWFPVAGCETNSRRDGEAVYQHPSCEYRPGVVHIQGKRETAQLRIAKIVITPISAPIKIPTISIMARRLHASRHFVNPEF